MEQEAEKYFEEIEKRGGVIKCLEEGYFQKEIAQAAYRYQQELEKKEKIIVGINEFVIENEKLDMPILKIDESTEKEQLESLRFLIEGEGYRTFLASNGLEAKVQINRSPIDLILLDIKMPGMDGVEFMKFARILEMKG